ncbi:hypothetical protein [Paenibacillus sinopodophylli]|uniref:hypothetical protein n=1 Tax=Paenibacillus sinopodophylli TaxID=1837342 RepID=UPI00110C9A26|nr:hypothetical protein [Paenibacillus sinopodophylli]
MSTSKLKKLSASIESARALVAIVVIGNEPTNYSQEAVDNFYTAIEEAEKITAEESPEGKSVEDAQIMLQTAEETFRSTEVPLPEEQKTKIVQLIGTDSERTGSHSLHHGKIIINFKDGAAELSPELADKLIEDGYAE